MSNNLYDGDLAAWATEQAKLLRRMAAGERVNDQVDWLNVAEEIEDVRKRYEDEIENRLTTLCAHLLKWQHQRDMRSNSWRSAVVRSRDRIAKLTRKMPTLVRHAVVSLPVVYPDARREAEAETGLVGMPEACPWTIKQVLDHGFWPSGFIGRADDERPLRR
jgi:hypothetical protein